MIHLYHIMLSVEFSYVFSQWLFPVYTYSSLSDELHNISHVLILAFSICFVIFLLGFSMMLFIRPLTLGMAFVCGVFMFFFQLLFQLLYHYSYRISRDLSYVDAEGRKELIESVCLLFFLVYLFFIIFVFSLFLDRKITARPVISYKDYCPRIIIYTDWTTGKGCLSWTPSQSNKLAYSSE